MENNLWTSGVLLDLDISYWRHQAKLQPSDLGLTGDKVPQIFTLGRKLLLDKIDMKEFSLIESRARTLVDRYSFPFILSSIRFVPYTVLPDVIKELELLKDIMNKLAAEFVVDYIDRREAFLNRYSDFRDALSPHYPIPEELISKFSLKWTIFEIRVPTDFSLSIEADEKSKLRASLIQKSQEDMANQVGEFISEVAQTLRDETAAICKRIITNVESSGQLRDVTLDSLRTFISRWRSMNFINDMEVEGQLRQLEQSIPSVGGQNTPGGISLFKDTLQKVYDSTSISKLGEVTYGRNLQF